MFLEWEGDIIPDRHRIEERGLLKHHAELTANTEESAIIELGYIFVIDGDRTESGLISPMICFIKTDFPGRVLDDLVLPRLICMEIPLRTASR